MRLRHATAQHIGDRSHQCDATATSATTSGGRAFVLLDGIGTSTTVNAWTRAQAHRLADLTSQLLQPHQAITQVQHEIAAAQPDIDGACAVIAVAQPDTSLEVAWIGDCRAYLRTPNGHLTQLTTDHNERAQHEARGEVAPPDARDYLTRCLGAQIGGDALLPESLLIPTAAGTRLLLASDGCYEPIEDAGRDLAAELDPGRVPAACTEHLIRLAITLGGENRDNATCLIADL
ncbi:PP2C family protein-serine/threonine phosphatase [Kitasatospora purpeofusca]|uniref:PP2C family protein-serine/threonine phosphatase n=1 Tax=Kitasatospora purpeofusca TaxID=67352 RepID=UPI0035DFF0BE